MPHKKDTHRRQIQIEDKEARNRFRRQGIVKNKKNNTGRAEELTVARDRKIL
jgi:hypothetical protein